MEHKDIDVRIDIEIGDTDGGYTFYKNGELSDWAELTQKERVKVCNSLIQGYNVFAKWLMSDND